MILYLSLWIFVYQFPARLNTDFPRPSHGFLCIFDLGLYLGLGSLDVFADVFALGLSTGPKNLILILYSTKRQRFEYSLQNIHTILNIISLSPGTGSTEIRCCFLTEKINLVTQMLSPQHILCVRACFREKGSQACQCYR